ncbi:hypothetical protein NCC49_003210 [Naganishia albida]|nr:hypothetical protein NCC49_003210 [Naganishia albida]
MRLTILLTVLVGWTAARPAPHGLTSAERMVWEGEKACRRWAEGERGNGCWKDRWEAQLKGVLANWGEFSEVSWSADINSANHAALSSILTCLPHFSPHPTPHAPARCRTNMLTVILGANWWLDLVLLNGGESGECVWLRTMVDTLREEGYTFLSVYNEDYAAMIKFYAAIPDVIHMIWASEPMVISCMADPRCRADFPEGEAPRGVHGVIPSWKMMTATYWGAQESSWEFGQIPGDEFSFNPLGHEWALVPFPYPGHTHIPFTLEKMCAKIPVVPPEERVDEAVVLGKLTSYFYPDRTGGLSPPEEAWESFHAVTGLWPIANARPLNDDPNEPPDTPKGVVNRGPVSRDEYTAEIGHARVFIGIGMPAISPSPYLALCQGVPALIPYDGDEPTPPGFQLYNLGLTQHGPAALLGEPYVYSYKRRDMQSMFDAVNKAKAHPIKPYIPDEMRHDHVARLTLRMVNRDWHAHSISIEKARRHAGKPVRRKIPNHVVQRVFGNGWGMRMMPDGSVSKRLEDVWDKEL